MGKVHWESMDFGITNLDDHDIFLRYDWLQHHNPEIDWVTGEIKFSHCPKKCHHKERIRQSDISMDIKIKESLGKEKKHWKEIIPQEYHDFPEVFEDVVFEKLQEHRSWDHAINFKEGTDIERKFGYRKN